MWHNFLWAEHKNQVQRQRNQIMRAPNHKLTLGQQKQTNKQQQSKAKLLFRARIGFIYSSASVCYIRVT